MFLSFLRFGWFFPFFKKNCFLGYYPHRSRDALSPVCGIFFIQFLRVCVCAHWKPRDIFITWWWELKSLKTMRVSPVVKRPSQPNQEIPPLPKRAQNYTGCKKIETFSTTNSRTKGRFSKNLPLGRFFLVVAINMSSSPTGCCAVQWAMRKGGGLTSRDRLNSSENYLLLGFLLAMQSQTVLLLVRQSVT